MYPYTYRSQLAELDKAEAFYPVDQGSTPDGGIAGRTSDRFVVGPNYIRGSQTRTSLTGPLALTKRQETFISRV
eukprot:scaffold151134_cov50-Prasinocladus_malaysianus.AAC.1